MTNLTPEEIIKIYGDALMDIQADQPTPGRYGTFGSYKELYQSVQGRAREALEKVSPSAPFFPADYDYDENERF